MKTETHINTAQPASAALAATSVTIHAEILDLAHALIKEIRSNPLEGTSIHIARIDPEEQGFLDFSVCQLGAAAVMPHHFKISAGDFGNIMQRAENGSWSPDCAALTQLLFHLRAQFTTDTDTARQDIEDYLDV